MPPSRFYEASDDDVDEEEEETSGAQNDESVLQCALHSFSPVYQLKWHYRSRHESLIRFSNHYYYDNELIIYPTAGRSGQRLGISFNYINDADFVNRRNNKEAEAVARAAIQHLIDNPSESLLVATMNIPQQELIESWIDRLTESDEQARVAVEEARSRSSEEFSVKNLENIQGHQRDVVMISMTYGKDAQSGRVMQRFGPITGKNGRRRLNVLFTRAKLRNEIFSSMTFQDINSKPSTESGVNDLRNYLRFAKDGILPEEGDPTGRPPDSDFEVSVMNVVRSVGLNPVPQVGVASYRIDIGVTLPEREGEYILGIECDGATYHSSRSARDRDRLREEVLVSRGWKIYRVWSTDWFYQHEEAKGRLLKALREATQTS
jgi:superfamily I DNA and/or RNA helicase/very-short-patch-repair endonuclease